MLDQFKKQKKNNCNHQPLTCVQKSYCTVFEKLLFLKQRSRGKKKTGLYYLKKQKNLSIVSFRHTRLQQSRSWWTLLVWQLLLSTLAARETCSSISLEGSDCELLQLSLGRTPASNGPNWYHVWLLRTMARESVLPRPLEGKWSTSAKWSFTKIEKKKKRLLYTKERYLFRKQEKVDTWSSGQNSGRKSG